LTDFHNFSCTTSQENAKVIGVKISCHTFVMLLPYRVKVSETKVTHFTLCTCLYGSHLQKPVSMKQTKHSRKSEGQNLCSKCPPFINIGVKCVTFVKIRQYLLHPKNQWHLFSGHGVHISIQVSKPVSHGYMRMRPHASCLHPLDMKSCLKPRIAVCYCHGLLVQ